jgi:hypothetical protein
VIQTLRMPSEPLTEFEIRQIQDGMRATAPWFQKHKRLLATNGLPAPVCAGTGGYLYPHTNLIVNMVPRNLDRIRSNTYVFVGLDEPAWFDVVSPGQLSLKDTLRACNAGCHVVRESVLEDPTRFGGYVVAASSPCCKNDTFDLALKKKGDRYYSCRIPAWNMNPRWTRDELMHVEDYRSNRDFGVRLIHDSEISKPAGS